MILELLCETEGIHKGLHKTNLELYSTAHVLQHTTIPSRTLRQLKIVRF